MKQKLFFTGLLVCLLSLAGFAQQSKNVSEESRLEGTYEIIQKGKVQEVFTTDILAEIEKRRDDTKEVTWEVSQYTTIRIFPRSSIKTPAVKPSGN